jgi:hypothetical protein
MTLRVPGGSAALALASTVLLSAFQAGPGPEQEFAGIVKAYYAMSLPAGWDALEKLPYIKWAPLPLTMLKNCLPDGGCFTRQGAASLGGRTLAVVATGARTMVLNLYFRNGATPFGEAAVVAAVREAGLTADLARCPVRGGAGSTDWYRLQGAKLSAGFLSIQAARGARTAEGFVLSHGDELPPLQPNQLALYSEQCAAGTERKPVSAIKPHQRLAEVVVALLAPAAGPPLYDWQALAARPTDIKWDPAGPRKTDLSYKSDPDPMAQSGAVTWGGRKFSAMASGTATQVRTIYLEEQGMHPRGEHMLGVVYEKGITVRLVRCGPVYTESTNNWYGMASAKTRPAMIQQSIRYEGNQVQDSYAIRLDGSLPARDPRDRDPGVNGCR